MSASLDNVPVEVIQRALEDSGMSITALARKMGWTRTAADTPRMRRQLGFEATSGSRRQKIKSVTYERALELLEAMGHDPVDYGL